ncbi:MAG: nucleotidyl transferase AbiEii/AbiGii toxin family protein [bacterium]
MPQDAYQKLSPRERIELLDASSRKSGLAPVILEKDYWVCRTLAILFALPDLGSHLVFKGGTSLSKVFRLIDRFSEDVDVSLHRDFLGFAADRDPEAATGKEQRRRLDALTEASVTCIRESLLPAFRAGVEEQLGMQEGWSIELDAADTQTILFRFPRARAQTLSYIQPVVRIELGARSDNWPREGREIRSFIGEALNLPLGLATVQALAAERTFWEKATLLHAEAHRDTASEMPARYARHYHDLARLAASPMAGRALADVELRKRVVVHKSVYFRSAWARYDLAVPATFRLVSPAERLPALEKDDASMQEMFFSPPPPMSEELRILTDLETKIRQLAE